VTRHAPGRLRRAAACLVLVAGSAAAAAPGHGGVVTLAPHLAELVFAAGAGAELSGVSAYSDYPPAVRKLPVIGDAFVVDHEQLALLDPDLVLAWQSGTPARVVDELRELGYRVEVIRTRGIDDVPAALRRIGDLTGNAHDAERAAARFQAAMDALARRWAGATPVRVFYQVTARPLYTINGDHYASDLIGLCGGVNIFAELGGLAPLVTEEAVLARDPEVLLAPGPERERTFSHWRRWPALAANRYGNRFTVPADAIGRATPRLADAGAAVCAALQQGRRNRAAAAAAQR